jgi:hypothetical protein
MGLEYLAQASYDISGFRALMSSCLILNGFEMREGGNWILYEMPTHRQLVSISFVDE